MVREHASKRKGGLGRGLVEYAKAACRKFIQKTAFDFGIYEYGKSQGLDQDKQFALVRHNSNKAGCRGAQPVRVLGEGCANGQCDNKIRSTRTQ